MGRSKSKQWGVIFLGILFALLLSLWFTGRKSASSNAAITKARSSIAEKMAQGEESSPFATDTDHAAQEGDGFLKNLTRQLKPPCPEAGISGLPPIKLRQKKDRQFEKLDELANRLELTQREKRLLRAVEFFYWKRWAPGESGELLANNEDLLPELHKLLAEDPFRGDTPRTRGSSRAVTRRVANFRYTDARERIADLGRLAMLRIYANRHETLETELETISMMIDFQLQVQNIHTAVTLCLFRNEWLALYPEIGALRPEIINTLQSQEQLTNAATHYYRAFHQVLESRLLAENYKDQLISPSGNTWGFEIMDECKLVKRLRYLHELKIEGLGAPLNEQSPMFQTIKSKEGLFPVLFFALGTPKDELAQNPEHYQLSDWLQGNIACSVISNHIVLIRYQLHQQNWEQNEDNVAAIVFQHDLRSPFTGNLYEVDDFGKIDPGAGLDFRAISWRIRENQTWSNWLAAP